MVLLRLIKNNCGQTILEAVIALAALLLILSASAIAIVTSVNNATFTRSQNQANKLAQGGMEEVRNLRNTNYTAFKTLAAGKKYCLGTSTTSLPNFSSPNANCQDNAWLVKPDITLNYAFTREVEFIENDTKECVLKATTGPDLRGTKVRVEVSWSSGRCPDGKPFCHSARVDSCFFPPL